MTLGKNLGIAALGYLAIGSVVAVWTVSRNHSNLTSFQGIGDSPSPATILTECIILWPFATYKNLAKG
jgi:hypothetical protein